MLLRLFCLILFFFILFKLISKNITKSILGYFSLYSISLSIISIFFIENGLYINELNRTSYSTGGTIRLMFYTLIFLFVFFKTCKRVNYNYIKNPGGLINNICYKFLPIISFVLLFYLYIDLFKSGIPLIQNALPSKYNYYLYVSTLPFSRIFYTLISFYLPIFWGICYSNNNISKKNKRWFIIYVTACCLYLLLIGFKVSGIRNVLVGFLLPIIYRKYVLGNLKFNFGSVKKIINILLVFLVALIINYSIFSNGMSVSEKIKNRVFALTSHFWWVTDEYRVNNKINANEIFDNFTDNFKLILNGEGVYSTKIGVAKLMKKFAPVELTNYYLSNNVRMGANFITVSVYDYGYIVTIFIVIIYAFIYSVMINHLGISILNGNVVEIVLIYKLLLYFETYLWSTGTLTEIFNAENLIITLFLFIYKALVSKEGEFKNGIKNI